MLSTREHYFLFLRQGIVSAKQRDAPESGKTYKCVDNTGESSGLPAANPGDKVESEKTDAAPVNAADDS